MRHLRLRPEAIEEWEASILWYNQRRKGLGEVFTDAIEESINLIQADPESYPFLDHDLRAFRVKRFPFSILFTVDNDEILVVSIFHERRDPKVWQSRLN